MERIEFFNAGMTSLRALYDGERLMQVRTSNQMNDDDLFFIVNTEELDSEELESEIRAALRRKYGAHAPELEAIEDVTDLYFGGEGIES